MKHTWKCLDEQLSGCARTLQGALSSSPFRVTLCHPVSNMREPIDGPKSPLTFQGGTVNALSVPETLLEISQRTTPIPATSLPPSVAVPLESSVAFGAVTHSPEVPHSSSAYVSLASFLTIRLSRGPFCCLKRDPTTQSLENPSACLSHCLHVPASCTQQHGPGVCCEGGRVRGFAGTIVRRQTPA